MKRLASIQASIVGNSFRGGSVGAVGAPPDATSEQVVAEEAAKEVRAASKEKTAIKSVPGEASEEKPASKQSSKTTLLEEASVAAAAAADDAATKHAVAEEADEKASKHRDDPQARQAA